MNKAGSGDGLKTPPDKTSVHFSKGGESMSKVTMGFRLVNTEESMNDHEFDFDWQVGVDDKEMMDNLNQFKHSQSQSSLLFIWYHLVGGEEEGVSDTYQKILR